MLDATVRHIETCLIGLHKYRVGLLIPMATPLCSPDLTNRASFYSRQVGYNLSSCFSWELMLWLTKEPSAKRLRTLDGGLDRNLAFSNAQTMGILLQELSS